MESYLRLRVKYSFRYSPEYNVNSYLTHLTFWHRFLCHFYSSSGRDLFCSGHTPSQHPLSIHITKCSLHLHFTLTISYYHFTFKIITFLNRILRYLRYCIHHFPLYFRQVMTRAGNWK